MTRYSSCLLCCFIIQLFFINVDAPIVLIILVNPLSFLAYTGIMWRGIIFEKSAYWDAVKKSCCLSATTVTCNNNVDPINNSAFTTQEKIFTIKTSLNRESDINVCFKQKSFKKKALTTDEYFKNPCTGNEMVEKDSVEAGVYNGVVEQVTFHDVESLQVIDERDCNFGVNNFTDGMYFVIKHGRRLGLREQKYDCIQKGSCGNFRAVETSLVSHAKVQRRALRTNRRKMTKNQYEIINESKEEEVDFSEFCSVDNMEDVKTVVEFFKYLEKCFKQLDENNKTEFITFLGLSEYTATEISNALEFINKNIEMINNQNKVKHDAESIKKLWNSEEECLTAIPTDLQIVKLDMKQTRICETSANFDEKAGL